MIRHAHILLITRTSSKQTRIDEYLSAEALPDLSVEELKEVESVFKGVHQRSFLVSIHESSAGLSIMGDQKLLPHMEDQTSGGSVMNGQSRL